MSENKKAKREKEIHNDEVGFDKIMKSLLSVPPKENKKIKERARKERKKEKNK